MAISMSEAFISRNGSRGEITSYDLVYYTFGESNAVTAETYALANTPATYSGYNKRTIAGEQIVTDCYKWTVNYGSGSQQVTVGLPTLAFNVGGGTVHITNSIANSRYRDSSLIPNDINFGGAIGVELNDDGTKARISGVDVFAPVLEYPYGMEFLNADVTTTYIDGVFATIGMNNATFYGRPAGSVLFKGCHGTKKGADKWELTFDFAYSPNGTSIPVGGITVASKRGWDYLDVLYKPNGRDASTNIRIMSPAMATVHQVYPLTDFSALGIGT